MGAYSSLIILNLVLWALILCELIYPARVLWNFYIVILCLDRLFRKDRHMALELFFIGPQPVLVFVTNFMDENIKGTEIINGFFAKSKMLEILIFLLLFIEIYLRRVLLFFLFFFFL